MILTGLVITVVQENLDMEMENLHGFRFMEIISLLRKHLHMQENMLHQIVSFSIMIIMNIGIIREIAWLQCVHPYTIRGYLMV